MIGKWQQQIVGLIDNRDQEQCGLILADGSAIAISNIAQDPTNEFVMDPIQWGTNSSKAICLWHTHWGDAQPAKLSLPDIQNAQALNLPTLCYHTGFQEWDFWSPGVPHPYPLAIQGDIGDRPSSAGWFTGWPFEYGRSDCYELFRLWYQQQLGIGLAYFDRQLSYEETLTKQWDLYRENAEAQGFRFLGQGEPRKKHDVFLINIGGHNPSHCAILLEPDTTTVLHHLGFGRLSEIRSIAGDIFPRTVATIRHHSQD